MQDYSKKQAKIWTHNPSEQLKKLIRKGLLSDDFSEIALFTKEAAPWHGRSTYGGLKNGVWRSPSDICTGEIATQLLDKAKKSVEKAKGFIEKFFGE